MKVLLGISAIAILFRIADVRAEKQVTGHNIIPVASKGVQYKTALSAFWLAYEPF